MAGRLDQGPGAKVVITVGRHGRRLRDHEKVSADTQRSCTRPFTQLLEITNECL